MMSARQASRLMRDVLSSDERGRLLLRTGIAGPASASPHGPAYEEADVHALRLRPLVDERELARVCPHGLWVCRLPRSAELDLRTSWNDVARQVLDVGAEQRRMTTLSVALAGVRITAWGPLPFVATFLGYVVLTADVVRLDQEGPQLGPPGGWSRALEGHRWHLPRGGRPQYVWTPPV
jgi:hypothetical protein